MSHGSRLYGAILLVSGTTIGAGMLALPVTTGLAGFLPAVAIMTFMWLFMMLTGFYFLEVNLRMRKESHLISMMGETWGVAGQVCAWVIYLLLLYALMAAYMMGCSQILHDLMPLPSYAWPILIFVIFATFAYLGTGVVDVLNRILMVGLALAYVGTLAFGCCKISPPLLTHVNWSFLLPSVAIVATTFGYHIIIPTLVTYLEYDERQLKQALVIGSLIPFVIYMAWEAMVMGIVPISGELSLTAAHESGEQLAFYLQRLTGNIWITISLRLFAFFAIVTSLLGVSLGLHDFLADGLKIKHSPLGKALIVFLTFFPPLFFTLFYPEGFVVALEYSGICVIILLALFPALMVWRERYSIKNRQSFIMSGFRVWGGKCLIVATILVSLLLLAIETL